MERVWDYNIQRECGTTTYGESVGLQHIERVWDYNIERECGTTTY